MTEILDNTDVNNIPADKVERAYSCGKHPGLKVRVSPTGNKVYYLYYKMGGKPFKYKIGKHGNIGLQHANKVAKKLRAEIELGDNPQLRRKQNAIQARIDLDAGITLRTFLDDKYFPHVEAHHKSAYRTKRILEHNFADAMPLGLSGINAEYIENWRSTKLDARLSNSTLNRAVSCLKATLNAAVRWNYIETNPLEKVSRLRVDTKGVIRYLSASEEKALLKALDDYKGVDYIKTFVTLLLNTGARPNEAKQLKWSDIDFARGLITLQAGYTKTGQTRYIPINEKLGSELKQWKKLSESEYIFSGSKGHIVSVQKPWNQVIKLSGIKNFRLYDLRHSFASKLMMNGADIYTVGELLGHTDTKTTQIYAHLSNDHLKSAVDLLC